MTHKAALKIAQDVGKLTGSRYWNALNPDLVPLEPTTDYDFVAEFNNDLAEYLKEHRFITRDPNWSHSTQGKQYPDCGTVIVFYNGDVQVILKSNVHKYLKLQEMLTPEFYTQFLWKKHNEISFIQNLLNALLSRI